MMIQVRAEKKIVFTLLLLSAVTHFVWLGSPNSAVFDEVHFGKFVTAYCCTGERFFDIHPPHAKLLIAGAAHLGGYRGGLAFAHIGESFGDISAVPLRFLPALWGALLPLVFYALLRQLGGNPATAFFGALLVVFDNALTVQTRLILLDGLLLLATFGALSGWLACQKRVRAGSRGWVWWAVLAGVLAGLAVGTKFTGLVALGLVGVLTLWQLFSSHNRAVAGRWFVVGVFILLAAGITYLLGWAGHFALLQEPGSGDAWGVPTWEQPLLLSFWRETVAVHEQMLTANYGLEAGHADASRWWGWPLMQTPVFYWVVDEALTEGGSRNAAMYFLGNPMVWWGGSIVFVLALLASLARWLTRAGLHFRSLGRQAIAIPLLGYLMALGPLITVPRALFLYHYLTPLLFSVLFGLLWLQRAGWITDDSIERQPPRYFALIGVLLALFIFFSPLTYGFVIDAGLHGRLFWFDSWM